MKELNIETLTLLSGSHANAEAGMCVMWPGRKNQDGYGITRGRPLLFAHRAAWAAMHGPIPEGMLVCHKCDKPACVNVWHLFLGTIADNNRDRHSKGRSKNLFRAGTSHPATLMRGERHWCAKLNDEAVAKLRDERAAGATVTALAHKYGINHGTVSRIARRIWR